LNGSRKIRLVRRFKEKQKQYIEKLFDEGNSTNSKLSAEQMAEKIKCETVNGLYYFLPAEEYLQPSQIRGFITRLKKQSNYLHDSFIGVNESEEAGIEVNYLEQLYTFGDDINRDPRGRVISVAYFALIDSKKLFLKADTDAEDAQWFEINKIVIIPNFPKIVIFVKLLQ